MTWHATHDNADTWYAAPTSVGAVSKLASTLADGAYTIVLMDQCGHIQEAYIKVWHCLDSNTYDWDAYPFPTQGVHL